MEPIERVRMRDEVRQALGFEMDARKAWNLDNYSDALSASRLSWVWACIWLLEWVRRG